AHRSDGGLQPAEAGAALALLPHLPDGEPAAGAGGRQAHLDYCASPLLSEPWVLDIDSTIKPLYGQQEGSHASPAASSIFARPRRTASSLTTFFETATYCPRTAF